MMSWMGSLWWLIISGKQLDGLDGNSGDAMPRPTPAVLTGVDRFKAQAAVVLADMHDFACSEDDSAHGLYVMQQPHIAPHPVTFELGRLLAHGFFPCCIVQV